MGVIGGQQVIRASGGDVEERQVPPVVHGKFAVFRPLWLSALVPVDTFVKAALHFEHMPHRVMAPGISWVEFTTAATDFFSLRKVIEFF